MNRKQLNRRIARCRIQINRLESLSSLSLNGHHSLGYEQGMLHILYDLRDELDDNPDGESVPK